jgi:hypothetical protein
MLVQEQCFSGTWRAVCLCCNLYPPPLLSFSIPYSEKCIVCTVYSEYSAWHIVSIVYNEYSV